MAQTQDVLIARVRVSSHPHKKIILLAMDILRSSKLKDLRGLRKLTHPTLLDPPGRALKDEID